MYITFWYLLFKFEKNESIFKILWFASLVWCRAFLILEKKESIKSKHYGCWISVGFSNWYTTPPSFFFGNLEAADSKVLTDVLLSQGCCFIFENYCYSAAFATVRYLQNNLITYISDQTFARMTYLRYLYVLQMMCMTFGLSSTDLHKKNLFCKILWFASLVHWHTFLVSIVSFPWNKRPKNVTRLNVHLRAIGRVWDRE